mgnify:CR=1 FL=1
MIVAFTGHRPGKLGGYGPSPTQDHVRSRIREELLRIRPDSAISGMALGVDQWAAEVCYEQKIPYTAAVPFDGQERVWPLEAQVWYRELLARAAVVHVVSPGTYAPWKLQRRNEWMVDNCDVLLAVWDGSPSGTANCVEYAREKLREIVRVDPRRLR